MGWGLEICWPSTWEWSHYWRRLLLFTSVWKSIDWVRGQKHIADTPDKMKGNRRSREKIWKSRASSQRQRSLWKTSTSPGRKTASAFVSRGGLRSFGMRMRKPWNTPRVCSPVSVFLHLTEDLANWDRTDVESVRRFLGSSSESALSQHGDTSASPQGRCHVTAKRKLIVEHVGHVTWVQAMW